MTLRASDYIFSVMKYPASVICLFMLLFSSLAAESVFESVAIVKTDFKITFDNATAEVVSQGITQRAVTETIKAKDAADDNIAYQAYHLEFAFKQKFSNQRKYSTIEFYRGNTVIHVMELSDPSRKVSTTRNRLNESNYMAINLEGIPLLMLDDVTRINFER